MVTRFLRWFLTFFYLNFLIDEKEIKIEVGEEEPVLPMVEKLRSITTAIDDLPESIIGAGVYDRQLLNTIAVKFSNCQHIETCLNIFTKALGDQLDDPIGYQYIQDRDATFENLGVRTVMLAYFQSHQLEGNKPLRETLNFITTEVEKLISLYTHIVNHPDIDNMYTQYLDRRLDILVRELGRYVDGIKNIGT